jgi:hypothetical protein
MTWELKKDVESNGQSGTYFPRISLTVCEKAENTDNQTDITPVNSHWKEIIRIMNTQKAVMTVSHNRYNEVIITRRCSVRQPGSKPFIDASNTNRYHLQNKNL